MWMVEICSTISWSTQVEVCVSETRNVKLMVAEDEAARFTFEICSAMAYTHEMGVTHRDLKPEVGYVCCSSLHYRTFY
jgi:serine/threonine protein kinase